MNHDDFRGFPADIAAKGEREVKECIPAREKQFIGPGSRAESGLRELEVSDLERWFHRQVGL